MHQPSKKSGCYLNFLPFRLSDAPFFGSPPPWEIRTWPRSTGYCEKMRVGMCFDWTDRITSNGSWKNIENHVVQCKNGRCPNWFLTTSCGAYGVGDVQKKNISFVWERNKNRPRSPTNTIRIQKNRVCNHKTFKWGKSGRFSNFWKGTPPSTMIGPQHLGPWWSCGRWALHHGGPMGGLETSSTQGGSFFLVGKRNQKKIETTRPSF